MVVLRDSFASLLLYCFFVCNLFGGEVLLPESIELEGNEFVLANDIRRALASDVGLTSELLECKDAQEQRVLMESKILFGYQNLGYLDAKVHASWLEANPRLKLVIEEGQKYRLSKVVVIGVPETESDMLLEALAGTRLSVQRRGGFIPQNEIPYLTRRVQEISQKIGFAGTKSSLAIKNDEANHEQVLEINIEDLGRPILIHDIRFSGLLRHDEQRLRESLKLSVGQPWNDREANRIHQALSESGRFQYQSVSVLPPLLDPSQAIVLIDLIEAKNLALPLFYEPLSIDQDRLRLAALMLSSSPFLESQLSNTRKATQEDTESEIERDPSNHLAEPTVPVPAKIADMLLSKDRVLIRVLEDHFSEVPWLVLKLSGLPANKDNSDSACKFTMSMKSSEGEKPQSRFMIAPFAFLKDDFEIESNGSNEIRYVHPKFFVCWNIETNTVTECELSQPDQNNSGHLRLRPISSEDWQAKATKMEESNLESKNCIKHLMDECNAVLDSMSEGHFATEQDFDRAWQNNYRLQVVRAIEKLLGEDSSQYRIFYAVLKDRTEYQSTFESSIESIVKEQHIGPITLWAACYFTKDCARQREVFAKLGISKTTPESIYSELTEFFERSEPLRRLHDEFYALAMDMPEQLLTPFLAIDEVSWLRIKQVGHHLRTAEQPGLEASKWFVSNLLGANKQVVERIFLGYIQTNWPPKTGKKSKGESSTDGNQNEEKPGFLQSKLEFNSQTPNR